MGWQPEVLTGQIDGLVSSFTTTFVRAPTQLVVFLDGVQLDPTDYVETDASTILFSSPLEIGQRLFVVYWTEQTFDGRIQHHFTDPSGGLSPEPQTLDDLLEDLENRIDALESGGGSNQPGKIIRPYGPGITLGGAVYQRSDGVVVPTNALAPSTSLTFAGFVSALNFPLLGQAQVQHSGDLADGILAGLDPGKLYVLSTTPGGVVSVEDTLNPAYPDTTPGSGHVSFEVGYAASATVFHVRAGALVIN